MPSCGFILRLICLWTLCSLAARAQSCPPRVCSIGGFDFSPLYWACNSDARWQYHISINQTLSDGPSSTPSVFYFNLCNLTSPVPPGCDANMAICRVGSGTAVSIGNKTSMTVHSAQNAEISLSLTGKACSNDGSPYQTFIYFKCGKSLGSPVLIDVYGCTYYFEWVSSVACKTAVATREIPCYIYDANHLKRDLTPLIKTSGGHIVQGTANGEKVIINVCRNVSSDPSMPACTGSVCFLDGSGQLTTFGSIDDGTSLLLTNRMTTLWLHYTATSNGDSDRCPLRTASVTFVCPADGKNKEPVLLSRDPCGLVVEWQTDYACPMDDLTSSTCQLTTRGGDDIDLTPLGSVVYNVTDGQYRYRIGLCGTTLPCNDNKQAAACQQHMQSRQERVLGKPSTQLLRYADGELSLRYRDGDSCNNGYAREIVINFHCNQTSAGSVPEFDTENNCTYLFDWDTPYACTNDSDDMPCSCSSGEKNFDLSRLVKIDRNWEVVQAGSSGATANSSSVIFINICHSLVNDSRRNPRIAACHPGASACLVYSNGSAINLGTHVDPPVYVESTSTIELAYRGGSPCSTGQTVESRIRFVCKPGDLGSSPVLIDVSDDGCIYFFEWRSAAACVEVNVSQDGCRVYDESLGIDFSLTALRQTGQDYRVRVEGKANYTYYINICGALVNPVQNGCKGAGACQVSDRDSRTFNIGNSSSVLTYSQGRLQLLYSGGDPYNDPAKTRRRTLIVFLCDPDAEIGSPEFISESNRTYLFYWNTREACLETIVQCMVSFGSIQYDLSSLSRTKFEDNWAVMIGNNQDSGKRKKIYLNVCRPVNYEPQAGCSATAAACLVNVNGTTETPDIRNLGEPNDGPSLVGDSLILVYDQGADCAGSNGNTSYSTKIHFICAHGKSGSGPRFVSELGDICQYTFIWEDEAACAVAADVVTSSCTVTDPETGYAFSLGHLASDNGYTYTEKQKTYKLSLCKPLEDDVCGKGASACIDGQLAGNASYARLHVLPGSNLQLVYGGGANGLKTEVHFQCSYDGEQRITGAEVVGKTLHLYFSTDAVCYPDSVDCFLTDSSGNQYDLSPLADVDASWRAYDSKHPNDTYFVSVCTPLNRSSDAADCPGGAISACLVATTGQPLALGYMKAEPTSSGDGSVLVSLTNGSACPDGPGRIQSKIKLFCSQVEAGPKFYSKTGCEYTFYWNTPQACPIKTRVGSNCSVFDPIRGIRYDLSSLRKDTGHYSMTVGKYTYLVNICGGIGVGGATGSGLCSASTGVCQKSTAGTGFDAGQANGELTLEGGLLKLNYTGGSRCRSGPVRSTVLAFVCAPTISGTQGPVFANETSCQYWFEWYTSAACAVRETACSFRLTNGSVYDLSALTLPSSNYVIDASTTENRTYYINVCRNLIHADGVGCAADAAACYRDGSTNTFVNTGRISHVVPVKNLFGEVPVLEYDHGDVCLYDRSRKFITHIMVLCDPSKEASLPAVVVNKEDQCSVFLIWRHAVGCAIRPSVSSGQCTVTSSTGYQFDLNPLRNLYNVTSGSSVYYLNLCGMNGSTPCGNTRGGICIAPRGGSSSSRAPLISGWPSSTGLDYDAGVLTMTYVTDAACPGGGNKSAVISFACNPWSVGLPAYLGDTDDCMFQFAWRTAYACSHEAVPCLVSYGSSVLDLALLSRTPYYPATSRVDSLSYYVSVCRPLGAIPGVGGACSAGSTVCSVDPRSGGAAPQSLGHVGSSPRVNPTTGRIELRYSSSSTCPSSAALASTTVVFRCSSTGLLGNPVLVSISSQCEYVFEWETSAVCLTNATSSTGKDCKVTDSSGYEFDLSVLRNLSAPYVIQAGNYVYKIGVCGKESSIQLCVIGDATTCKELGRSREGDLQLQPGTGGIALQYPRTGQCNAGSGGGTPAQIIFECSDDADVPGTLSVAVADQCSPLFVWKTPLACKPVLAADCVVHFGTSNYDLLPLARSAGYWSVAYKSTGPDGKSMTFYVNVCESIHLDSGPLNGVAVALNKSDPTLTTIGLLRTQTVFYDGSSIVLGYSQSTFDCTSSQPHARIAFACGPHLGSPSYQTFDYQTCAYMFTWSTHLVCLEGRKEVSIVDGKILDPISNMTMDLTSILSYIPQPIQEGQDSDTYIYLIMLNGITPTSSSLFPSELKNKLGRCVDLPTVVCMINIKDQSIPAEPVGLLGQRKLYLKDGLLQAVIGANTICEQSGRPVESIIDFHCDHTLPEGRIRFTYKSSACQYIFDWYTPAVCEDINSESTNVVPYGPTQLPVLGHSLTAGSIVGIVISAAAIIAAVTTFGVIKLKRRRDLLLPGSTTSANYGSESSIGYSQLQSSEDQPSLLGGSQLLGSLQYNDDSDEDLIV